MRTKLLSTVGLVVVALGLAGCSPSATDRREISGKVTYNGEAVPNGTIFFETDVGKGNNGPQGVADIKSGQYKTRPEFGAVAGPHVVKITILPGGDADPGDAKAKRTGGVRPGEYVTNVDIQPGVNSYDFALPFDKAK